jgi:NADH dehydrogenase
MIGSDERRTYTLHYDHLIWCLGLKMDLSQVPGMAAHGLPIKTLGDAFHLRNHVLRRFEQAELETDEQLREKALTFVAVGGGFSGVETIAAINDMARAVLPFYPKARATGTRIVLVHSGVQVLPELDAGLGGFARAKLQERGVEIRLNTTVSEATAEGVTLSTGETVPAGTVVCTVGNAPHPLVAQTGLPQERGRILVDEFMRVQGADNLWAIGDAALIPNGSLGGYCPPTAQYAVREGRQCARNILAATNGGRLRPFQFGGVGQLAVVGRYCGVGSLFGRKISGLLAWWLWRSVYLAKVPSLRCKVLVSLDWLLEALFPRDTTMIDVRRTEQLERAHFRPGDVIIRQGEVGDRFYVIESGEVKIIHQEPGQPETCLGTRGAGDSFGELALVKNSPRTATVRCVTPVDVLVFKRADFQALVGSFQFFRAHIFDQVVHLAAKDAEKRQTVSGTVSPEKPVSETLLKNDS